LQSVEYALNLMVRDHDKNRSEKAMTLKKQGYLSRIIDTKVAEYLGVFGAVSIEGPKWCGRLGPRSTMPIASPI
jgi:hypothetical protein